jgi:glutaredoxin
VDRQLIFFSMNFNRRMTRTLLSDTNAFLGIQLSRGILAQRRAAMRMLYWLFAGVAIFWTVSPAGADSLVLMDGTRLETRGEFKVKGRQVVFTDVQGRLKALPLAEVDIEASKAPPPVVVAPQAAVPVEKKVVMTLTNKDVGEFDPLVASLVVAQQKSVEMYTTTWCPACKKARSFFERIGIPYTDYDVEADPEARRRQMSLHPSCGVPVINIEGTVLCGLNGQAIFAALGIQLPPRPDARETPPTSVDSQ